MPIRGAEYAVTRVTATLQAQLPAELDLIDAEMGDFSLDDVPDAAYLEYEATASLVEHPLAIIVNAEATEPMQLTTHTNSPGVYHCEHRIVVRVDLKDSGNEEPAVTKKRVLRYARAIERVLAIKYPTLPNAGVETVQSVKRIDAAIYVLDGQEPGQFVRSATIPFMVTNYETL